MPRAAAEVTFTAMATIQEMLFEDPMLVYLALAAVGAVLAAAWLAKRSRRRKLALAVPVALILVVAVAEHLVVTDREYVDSALVEIAAGAEAGDFAPAQRHMHADCSMPLVGRSRLGKAILLAKCKSAQSRSLARSIKLLGVTTLFAGDEAVTDVSTRVTVGSGEQLTLRWRLEWVRADDRWQIIKVELLEPADIREMIF